MNQVVNIFISWF